MVTLFSLDIAKIVNDEIAGAGGVLDATLTKVTPGTRTPGSLTGGTNPTTANFAAKGFRDSLSRLQPNTRVREANGLILLLGASIAGLNVPEPGDSITIESETFEILAVDRDPAAAVYECQVA